LGSHPWVALPKENALVGLNLPYNETHMWWEAWFCFVYPNLVQFVLSCNIISLLRFHWPVAAICYYSGGSIPSLPDLFGMGQDHYGPIGGLFHIRMWQLAHVKAYIRPILRRINTVAPVTIAFPVGGEGIFQSVTSFPNT
jgi:hypothetical protein